jgi:hypothetical protein
MPIGYYDVNRGSLFDMAGGSSSPPVGEGDIMSLMNEQVGGNLGDNISRASTENAENVAYWQALWKREQNRASRLRGWKDAGSPASVALLMMGGSAAGGAFSNGGAGFGAGGLNSTTGTATISGSTTAAGSTAAAGGGASAGAADLGALISEGMGPQATLASGGGGGGFSLGKLFGGLGKGGSMNWAQLAMQGGQSLLGMRGARRARQEREAGIAEARGVQEGALDQTMGLFQPQREAGEAALRRMLGMQGLPGGDTGFDINQDPSYQFRRDESMRALESGAAARGGLLSGGFARQALQLAGNFASQEYANIYNRLAGMVNLGMGASTQQANALSGYSSNISNLITGRGEARAVGSAEKYNQLMDLAGAAGDYFGGRGSSGGKVVRPEDIFED